LLGGRSGTLVAYLELRPIERHLGGRRCQFFNLLLTDTTCTQFDQITLAA